MNRVALVAVLVGLCAGQSTHWFGAYQPQPEVTADAEHQILMNPMNLNAEMKAVEREVNASKAAAPWIFGKVNDVFTDVMAKAKVTKMEMGRLHSLGFGMQNALSFAFYFESFHIPEGAALFLVSDHEVAGPWTSKNNYDSGVFQTRHVKGNYVEVRYFQQNGVKALPILKLAKVTTAFRAAKAGTCNINSVCIDPSNTCNAGCKPTDSHCSIQCTYLNQNSNNQQWAGADWANQVRGAVAVGRNYASRYCSGSFINNKDGKAYVLTAAHCGPSGSDIVQLGFSNPSCTSGDDNAGPTNFVLGNLKTLTRNTRIDNELIEVADSIEGFDIYLNGWEAGDQNTPAQTTVGIHHPSGSNKKISHSDVAVTPDAWSGGGGAQDHWRVAHWSEATTEPGSSGSPLFNQATKRIIGQLHGGTAACPAHNGWDSYGAVWAGYEDGMKAFLGDATSMDGAPLKKKQ